MRSARLLVVNQLALDVGCCPGALTTELVKRLGSATVTADPSYLNVPLMLLVSAE